VATCSVKRRQIVLLLGILAFFVVLGFVLITAWGRTRTQTMASSTNRLLFAVVILLFALVFKLVSTGMDVVVLVIGLVGVGVGWYGISIEPQTTQPPQPPLEQQEPQQPH
jgi:hypothetical protein